MRLARFVLALGILAPTALHPLAFAQKPSPDLVLFNGKIFTSNASQPHAEALAIRGDRIIAVGTSKEVAALAGRKTRRTDLGGRTVIPGINDARMHLAVEPSHYDVPLKNDDPTWQEMTDALSAASSNVAKGTWIEGNFGPTLLDDPHATRATLDAIAPDHLVVLWAWTGHASLLNTAAMEKLGVREDEPDPAGGTFVRNHGKLTGMSFEYGLVVNLGGMLIEGVGGLGAEVAIPGFEVKRADAVRAADAGELHATLDSLGSVVSHNLIVSPRIGTNGALWSGTKGNGSRPRLALQPLPTDRCVILTTMDHLEVLREKNALLRSEIADIQELNEQYRFSRPEGSRSQHTPLILIRGENGPIGSA